MPKAQIEFSEAEILELVRTEIQNRFEIEDEERGHSTRPGHDAEEQRRDAACGGEMNAGDYYDRKREEADRLIALIRETERIDPKNAHLLANLRRQLQLARYVGD